MYCAFLFVYIMYSPQLYTRKRGGGGGGHDMYFSCKNVIVNHFVECRQWSIDQRGSGVGMQLKKNQDQHKCN